MSSSSRHHIFMLKYAMPTCCKVNPTTRCSLSERGCRVHAAIAFLGLFTSQSSKRGDFEPCQTEAGRSYDVLEATNHLRHWNPKPIYPVELLAMQLAMIDMGRSEQVR